MPARDAADVRVDFVVDGVSKVRRAAAVDEHEIVAVDTRYLTAVLGGVVIVDRQDFVAVICLDGVSVGHRVGFTLL